MNSVTTGTDVNKNFSAWPALPYSLVASLAFLVLLCIAYAINAADRQIFPTLLPAIRQAFGYDLKTAGLMSTVFTIGLAVAGIPTGYLVDRVSRKAIILGAMVIYSAFTLATVYAFDFWDMLFYRALTGVGEGMQMAALFAAVGAYFYRKRSFFISWMMLAYGVGAFLGPRIGSTLAQAANDWKTPFICFAVTGLAIAAMVLVCIPQGFTESKGPGTVAAAEETTLNYMPASLWNRNVILGTLGCIVLGYSLYGYIGLYTTYLQGGLKFSPADAAAALSFFGLGGFLSLIGGWFGDRFPQHWVIAIAFALLAIIEFSMYNASTSLQTQSFLSFMTGAIGSGFVFVNLLSLLQRSVRPQMVGRASGIFLTTLFGAGSTAGYLMGWLVGIFGWGSAALIELTLFPVIAIVAMLMVNPKQLIPVAKKS